MITRISGSDPRLPEHVPERDCAITEIYNCPALVVSAALLACCQDIILIRFICRLHRWRMRVEAVLSGSCRFRRGRGFWIVYRISEVMARLIEIITIVELRPC